MGAIAAMLYGVASYAMFTFTVLYAIGFVANWVVPKGIDAGTLLPWGVALPIDVALLALFEVQHSLMARPFFKRWWTRVVPKSVERSTYVLFASSALLLLFWQWRPVVDTMWLVENPNGVLALDAVSWLGWGILFAATFMINHFELFGLRQVWARLRGRSLPQGEFKTPLLYRYVRHPIYLGFLLAFWATPWMTVGHFVFAGMATLYILVGIAFEEHDLVDQFGEQYVHYRAQVGMLLPWRRAEAKAKASLVNQAAKASTSASTSRPRG